MAKFVDLTALEIDVKGESTPLNVVLHPYATHLSVEISLSYISVAPFVDVTALEIEVKGESTPLNVVLHPYATHLPGKNLVGTKLKKMITVTKYIFLDIVNQGFNYECVSKIIFLVSQPKHMLWVLKGKGRN